MTYSKILHIFLAVALLTLAACSSDSGNADEPETGAKAVTIGLSAKQTGAAASRALPQEASVGNEGKIHNATLVFYSTPLNEAKSSDQVVTTIYSDFTVAATSQTVTVSNVKMYESSTYYVLAIVNAGDLTSDFEGASLTTLRDATIDKIVNTASKIADYDCFVMVSDTEHVIDFTAAKQEEIVVERLAARVDLQWPGFAKSVDEDTEAVSYFVSAYLCDYEGTAEKDANGDYIENGDKVEIQSVTLKNVNSFSSEYLVQRSSAASGGTSTYFSDEAFGTIYSNYAARYVQCPSDASASESIELNLASALSASWQTADYIGEYTAYNYSSDSATGLTGTYPCLEIKGTYLPKESSGESDDFTSVIPIRHGLTPSEGSYDYEQPMACAVIRNTIYRYSLRFFRFNNSEILLYVNNIPWTVQYHTIEIDY